ncbi:MAG: glycoside hydrolase family 5 protein [Bacteroidales bacterium]|nr:glycoside hydrolase family 5 protein [Bacteroidales bacterium]MCF8391784.1 glycoside hydrolase family 5 protein [Bacteroidales bacterium]
MKKNLTLLLLSFIFLFSCTQDSKKEPFLIKKGVNISHWLSQSNRRGADRELFFTHEDVKLIASFGYDHIRLPIDEEQLWDEDGNREEEAFELLHNAINWSRESDLRIIIDLHIIRSHHFNAEIRPLWTDPAEQEKLVNLWMQLSDELKIYPNGFLAYEIMNEAVADDPNDWNKLIALVLSEIRKTEPNRKIVVGSNMWQSVSTFNDLVIPENDENIILSFHFYHPFAFTHHMASWTSLKDYTGPVHYPGMTITEADLADVSVDVANTMREHVKNYNRDSMISDIQMPLNFAREHNLPLYCGEFGCLPTMNLKDMLLWYSDFVSVLEENGVAWANWDYKGSFGIVNGDLTLKNNLVETLFQE